MELPLSIGRPAAGIAADPAMLAHNVAALLKSPPGTIRDVEIDEPFPRFGPEIEAVRPARGAARFTHTQGAILASCHVNTTVEVECSRCLDPFGLELDVHFSEEFRPSVSVVSGSPLPGPEDDALRIDDRHVLDLTEITRQYLMMEIPIKPVCRPDCAGICPTCGVDLNSGICSCGRQGEAGPFGALARLLPNTGDGEPPLAD